MSLLKYKEDNVYIVLFDIPVSLLVVCSRPDGVVHKYFMSSETRH